MTRDGMSFRQSLGGYAFIAPWLVGFLIFTAGPMIGSLAISLHSWSMLSPPTWVGFENYQSIITEDPLFLTSLWNTGFYVIFSVPLCIAAGLALAGKRVLLVDTDTQGQSSFMLGVKPKGGLTELVTEELSPKEAIIQARKNLWLLAGGKSLAGLKRLIDRKDYGGELTIAQALTPLEKDYDYVVVDTSPGWDPLTVNVLFYVNELMTPVSLEVMSIQGFGEFLKSIASIQKFRKEVELRYILPTFRDMRVKRGTEFLEEIEKIYGEEVCSPIRYNVRLSEAPAYGQTIFEFAPGSNGAQDYRDLVRKVTGEPDLFT